MKVCERWILMSSAVAFNYFNHQGAFGNYKNSITHPHFIKPVLYERK